MVYNTYKLKKCQYSNRGVKRPLKSVFTFIKLLKLLETVVGSTIFLYEAFRSYFIFTYQQLGFIILMLLIMKFK